MRVAYVDAASGASGDMWLGALVGAGASIEAIQAAVDALGAGAVRLSVARVRRAGVAATAVRVHAPEDAPPARTWHDIRTMLADADLPEQVRTRARDAFERLARAEAAVHDVDVDAIEFHEVGSLDAIADILGTCAGVVDLGLERLTCGPIAVGSGTVETMHGTLPVPPPAVTQLLRDRVVTGGPAGHELTTPTGAALLAELTRPVAAMPTLRLEAVGVGAGGRDLEHPNVLRLLVGTEQHTTVILEATVDDLSPELVPIVLDRLREAGAHDAWATPVLMKKGRPGYTLSALGDQADLGRLQSVLFRESTTIGARWYPVSKRALDREWIEVEIDGHAVRVKVARDGDVVVNVAPEADDVRAAADATGRPAREIAAEATSRARARGLDSRGT
ncbi:MAG: nickel pincer cofactor biosynthesis protein LarC [Actinobacteria bacterium]|nr:nickel pincer cofactor biosynthesis protein LarC [Actinomycetota bacterium]